MSSTELDPPPFTMPQSIDPYVMRLVDIVGLDALETAVGHARQYNVAQMQDWGIYDANTFLQYASGTLRWIPSENQGGTEIYYTLCLFYFILDQEPIKSMQTPITPKSIDGPLSPVSQWISGFAVKVGDFMDTPASLTEDSLASYTFEGFHMEEADPPEDGFKTFNQLFCRRIKDGSRPIEHKEEDRVITWPADSKFDGAWPIDQHNTIHIKGVPWPIDALLGSSKFHKEFEGGTWMHAFLGPTDYHRQHAPVRGNVVESKVIQGLCYLEVKMTDDDKGRKKLQPHRSWRPKETRGKGDYYRALDAPDEAGYQFIQTRGCVVIDNPVIGLVAVLPIGMAYVSSVKLSVRDIYDTGAKTLPTYVEKGDEISCFQFGGSDIVLCFQKGKNVDLKHLQLNKHYSVGNVLADTRLRGL